MPNAAISFELIDRAKEAFPADRANIVAKNAVTSKGIRAAARVPEAVARDVWQTLRAWDAQAGRVADEASSALDGDITSSISHHTD